MTITVTDSYTVHSGKALEFTDEMGFDMQWPGDGPAPSLTIAGSVSGTGDSTSGFLVGVGASDETSPTDGWNKSTGVLTVAATGGSSGKGVAFDGDGSFRNDGNVSVSSAAANAYGVDGYSLNVQVVNSGVLEVSAAQI